MKYSLALAMALVATPALAQFPNVTRAGTPYFYGTGGISLRQERVPLSYGMNLHSEVAGQPPFRPLTLRTKAEWMNQQRIIQRGVTPYDVLLDRTNNRYRGRTRLDDR